MRISDWSSDVCSSDLGDLSGYWPCHASARSPPSSPATDRPSPPPPPDRSLTTVGRASPPLAHPSRYAAPGSPPVPTAGTPEEHPSELQSLIRNSYSGFCLKKKHTIEQFLCQNHNPPPTY